MEELTAFVVDDTAVRLLRGHGAGRAVVGKLLDVALPGTHALTTGDAARRPGDPLGHHAGGRVWGRGTHPGGSSESHIRKTGG